MTHSQCGASGRLGVDHDLVLLIHRGDAVVALNDAVGGDHFGALVVGDVALHRLAARPNTIIVFGEPAGYPVRFGPDRFSRLLLRLPCSSPFTALILLAMTTHEVLD